MITRLLALLNRVRRSSNTRIVWMFAGTFICAGVLVYFFEHETGYGDKFPATLGGRLVAGLTMCMGIVSAGLVTGNIASWLVDRKLKEGRGLVNLGRKSRHTVICGWRRDMTTVLGEILKLHSGMQASDLVIVAPISIETLDAFRQDERFREVAVVRADYFSPQALEHACVRTARQALILADWSDPGQSVTSVDSKTVMAALAIRKLAPEIHLTAELVDPKFESYLRLSHCDEILTAREIHRSMMSRIPVSRGLSHVLYDLLSPETPTQIALIDLAAQDFGISFGELRKRYRSRGVVVGVLENTGNPHRMKKEALSSAQKNPDTRTVLRNLKAVRELRPNMPLLNPGNDYVVKPYSRLVAVARRPEPGRSV